MEVVDLQDQTQYHLGFNAYSSTDLQQYCIYKFSKVCDLCLALGQS